MKNDFKANILIVDDNVNNLKYLSEILKSNGYDVRPVREGPVAIMSAISKLPDLILLDIKMPGMSGYEVCEYLKADERTRDIPVIFISVMDKTADKVKGFSVGGVDYVTKPFQPEEILSRINAHLTIYRMRLEQAGQLHSLQREIEGHRQTGAELEKYKDRLEQLVDERTAELKKSNEQLQGKILKRKQAEKDLRASELQYRLLADRMADGLGIFQKQTLVFVNKALIAMFGDHELLYTNPAKLIKRGYQTQFRKWLQNRKETSSFQAPSLTACGKEIWTEWYLAVIKWSVRSATLLTVRDITENKLREIAIRDEKSQLERENLTLRTDLKDRYKFGPIIGKSPVMHKVYELISEASVYDFTVLLQGESGTGKELAARMIHSIGLRSNKPFVAVNCGALSESLFETEFFGHREGGAEKYKQGFFDQAHSGTLFLDEISELKPAMQVKLLRTLEDGEYTPVGDNVVRHADFRIIAATNKDLKELLRRGDLRDDFFYRIHVVLITMPPLRERKEDILLLVEHFSKLYGADFNDIPGRVIETFCQYDWPGNVRELQNNLQQHLSTGHLHPSESYPEFSESYPEFPIDDNNIDTLFESYNMSFNEILEHVEKHLISKGLEQNSGNKRRTSMELQIPLRTLHRKIDKYGLR